MPSDLIKVIPYNLLPNPGTCRYCGSNQRDCVDFGVTMEYEGALLICTQCFLGEVTKVDELQLVSRKEVAEMYDSREKMQFQLTAIALMKEALRSDLVAVLDSHSNSINELVSGFVSVPPSDSIITEKLF